MKFETIQNFTVITDINSPFEIDLESVPENNYLRLIINGNISEEDAVCLGKFSEKFKKCSIVVQTEVVSDLSFLSVMKRINHFSINRYTENELESLKYLPNDLEQLSIASFASKKGDLSFLKRFTNLKKLVIDSESKDLSIISELKSLEDLQLFQVKGFDLDILKDLPNLKRLLIRFGDIRDLSPLSKLVQLEYLDIWKLIDIEDLEWLEKMISLKSLEIGALNKVSRFPNLGDLKQLKYVQVEQLKALENIDNIATAPAIEKLNLIQMNQIPVESFNSLLAHPSLKEVTTGYSSKKKRQEVENTLKLPSVNFEPFYHMKEF